MSEHSAEKDAAIEFTPEQIARLGHWLSECLDDAAPLNERAWRSRAAWMVKGPTFQGVLREVMSADRDVVDLDGQTLRQVLLARLRWEYGDDTPWEELGSLTRLERDVRLWFKEQCASDGLWVGTTNTHGYTADEHTAFVRTVIYHQRKTSGDDGCTNPGCGLRVGESFAEHLWERFNELRPIASDKGEFIEPAYERRYVFPPDNGGTS